MMERAAKQLGKSGWTLRSGGAAGADSAFQRGCDLSHGNKEIFIPWNGFNNNNMSADGIILAPSLPTYADAVSLMKRYHPAPNRLSQGAEKLQSRNGYQLFGRNLVVEDKSTFVLCYTTGGRGSGGTGQAIRIANDYGIKVYDLGLEENVNKIKDWLGKLS